MATRNRTPKGSQSRGEDLTPNEEVDIATAIAASLDTPQGVASAFAQRSGSEWVPKTIEDWEVYNRQISAMTVAEKCSKYTTPSNYQTEPSQ